MVTCHYEFPQREKTKMKVFQNINTNAFTLLPLLLVIKLRLLNDTCCSVAVINHFSFIFCHEPGIPGRNYPAIEVITRIIQTFIKHSFKVQNTSAHLNAL